jgi:O-antigen ligase
VPGRIAGTTGLSPNFLGALFVLSLPLTVALALEATERRTRVAWWVAVTLQVLALTLTFTRTSLVIAVAILAVLLLSRGHARVLLVLGALVTIVAVATPLGMRLVGDANDRAALWTSAMRMTLDHPLTGVGPGRMLAVAASDPARYKVTEFGEATSNAHNTILLAGAETGVLGAIGSLIVNLAIARSALVAVFAGLRRSRAATVVMPAASGLLTTGAALGVLGFLVQGMTNNLFAVRVTSVAAMLVLSAFLIFKAPDPGDPPIIDGPSDL